MGWISYAGQVNEYNSAKGSLEGSLNYMRYVQR